MSECLLSLAKTSRNHFQESSDNVHQGSECFLVLTSVCAASPDLQKANLLLFFNQIHQIFSWNNSLVGAEHTGVFLNCLDWNSTLLLFCFLARLAKLTKCFVTFRQHHLQQQKVSLTPAKEAGSSGLHHSLAQKLHWNQKKVNSAFCCHKHTAEQKQLLSNSAELNCWFLLQVQSRNPAPNMHHSTTESCRELPAATENYCGVQRVVGDSKQGSNLW